MIAAMLLAAAATWPTIPDSGFEPWFRERDVEVSRTRTPGETPWIRAVVDLPASADAVYGVVTDYARYLQFFDPAVSKADVLESSDRSARIHFVWPYPFPFRRRDAIVAYFGGPFEAGGHRLTWSDDARASDPSEGVRIRRVAGETRIAPLAEGRCRVTYTFLGDLGGDFPDAFETKAWRHEPLGYVYALRRRLGLPVPPK